MFLYQICYKGSYWNVETSKFDTNFVFARGWPEMCNDVGILEDYLLIFKSIDDVVFKLLVYRNETEICLSKKPESDDDSVLEISKADYVENDIYEDDKVASVGKGKSVTQKKLATNAECTSNRRMSSRLYKTQDVKNKGKVTSERKETVKYTTKRNVALPIDTIDHIGCSSSAYKVKGKRAGNVQKKRNRRNKSTKTEKKNSEHLLDPEFFHFLHKGDYRLCLPAEVARRAGLSVDLHPFKVQNMVGVVDVYDVKTELNECKPRYALDGWRKFMTENNLRFGDMLHFTYVSSQ
ncbi:putative transcription factor B3-Domain family [Helianthus annuus]|nr:putative transcription factor B3-Domain family [Helianthus annuus]